MDVHRALGPGQDEAFYHAALCEALSSKSIPFQHKPQGQLIHRGVVADEFEADLIVAEAVVPELKVLHGDFAQEHFTQVICYLKFWRNDLGLLIDFGKESLVHKRVPYTEKRPEMCSCSGQERLHKLRQNDLDLANALIDALVKLYNQYGLGYRDTTYTGLVRAELLAEGFALVEEPTTSLSFGGRELGLAKLNCLQVANRCIVKVYALYDEIHAAHRATVQAYLRHLDLPFGLIANFGRRRCQIRIVVPASA